MTNNNHQRKGSLQFYPRVRAKKIIPRVNWNGVKKDGIGILGFVGYKVGMTSVYVKDNTENSLTKGKKIVMPGTIIECPKMNIYSVRFYKNKNVLKDFIVNNSKDLRKKVKLPKDIKKIDEELDFDDVRIIAFSGIKDVGAISQKNPDFIELGLNGSKEEKLEWVKSHLDKSFSINDAFVGGLVDIVAVTKGYGTQGPMKRFGIALKSHKSEKGRRRPGSLSSFGLRRVTFRAPQAGQTGFHTRIAYNNVILKIADIKTEDINMLGGFHKYGNIKNDYVIVKGSIPGPKKRAIILKQSIRPTKYQTKQNYEFINLR